jgi:hypothetical protein
MTTGSAAVSLAVVVLFGVFVPPASAQDRQIGGVGVTVFEDPEFRGRSATFREDVPDLRKFNLNDRITSLRITRGEMWEACIDIDYGGRCQVFTGSEPDLHDRSGWNDEISSLRRVRGGARGGGRPPVGQPQIVLFDRTGFRGSSRQLTGPMSSLGSFGARVQSVRIMRGRWELCEGTRWSDRCLTVNESITDIGRAGLSRVSSARPR